MSSESPGNIGKREMLNLKKPNQMREISRNPGDKCLPILPSPLQQRQSPSKTTKRNSNPSNIIRPPPHHHYLHHPLLLLLLLLNLVPYAAANGFCSPLLCSCQVIFQPSLLILLLVVTTMTLVGFRWRQQTVQTEASQRCPEDSEKLSKSSTLLKMTFNQVSGSHSRIGR